MTGACLEYPRRLLDRLGSIAPPAFWWNGASIPRLPTLTIVGSRAIDEATSCWCRDAALEATGSGLVVVSGGAPGCDRAAIDAVGRENGLEIWPCGIDMAWTSFSGPVLSLAHPNEPFSRANAMERNALLYSVSVHALVGAVQFKVGGTWHGATEALRKRLCRVIVREDGSKASAALLALGAIPLRMTSELSMALEAAEAQGHLDLIVPNYAPRCHSKAGEICEVAAKYAA